MLLKNVVLKKHQKNCVGDSSLVLFAWKVRVTNHLREIEAKAKLQHGVRKGKKFSLPVKGWNLRQNHRKQTVNIKCTINSRVHSKYTSYRRVWFIEFYIKLHWRSQWEGKNAQTNVAELICRWRDINMSGNNTLKSNLIWSAPKWKCERWLNAKSGKKFNWSVRGDQHQTSSKTGKDQHRSDMSSFDFVKKIRFQLESQIYLQTSENLYTSKLLAFRRKHGSHTEPSFFAKWLKLSVVFISV